MCMGNIWLTCGGGRGLINIVTTAEIIPRTKNKSYQRGDRI